MKLKKSTYDRIKKFLNLLLLIALSIVFLFPLYWLFTTSIKTDDQIYKVPPQWIPNPVTFAAYPRVFKLIDFPQKLINTLTITIFTIIGTCLSCGLVAYSFSRLTWKGRDVFFVILLSTMMIPWIVTMIPMFVVFLKLGWVDTFKPLIIPSFFGNAYYIFLLRQFFMTIPFDLSDAAKVDSASELQIFFRIMLPLAKPIFAVVSIFQFMASWNDFMGPLIYLNDPEKFTLGLAVYVLTSGHQGSIDWTGIMAAGAVQVIPVLIIFFFTQRYFIEGITLTGIKG